MKIVRAFFLGIILLFSLNVKAQVSVNVNIGPLWGPVGYTDVRYYYLPDVQAYYDIQTAMFIYYEGGVWIHRNYLPTRYSNYDLYSGYKVVMINYYGNTPYVNYNAYKTNYPKGYHVSSQKTIGEHPGNGSTKTISHNKPQGNVHHGNKNSPGQGSGKSHSQGKGKKK